jgi:hypothetical protein
MRRTLSFPTLWPNRWSTYFWIAALASSVRSSVAGSSSSSNFVHTTRCTIRSSIPYGQSFFRILISPSFSKSPPSALIGSAQCRRCLSMKFMIEPWLFLIFWIYARYRRRSEGMRWKRSIRFREMIRWTEGHDRIWYEESGVLRIPMSFADRFCRNGGQVFDCSEGGTFTCQYGRGVTLPMATRASRTVLRLSWG